MIEQVAVIMQTERAGSLPQMAHLSYKFSRSNKLANISPGNSYEAGFMLYDLMERGTVNNCSNGVHYQICNQDIA